MNKFIFFVFGLYLATAPIFVAAKSKQQTFTLGRCVEDAETKVRVSGSQWRYLSIDDLGHLSLSLTDSIDIKRGKLTVNSNNGGVFVGYKGKWSVEDIVNGKASAAKSTTRPTDGGYVPKSLSDIEDWSIDVVTKDGMMGTSFRIGTLIKVVIANNTDKDTYVHVWWYEQKEQKIWNFCKSENGILIPAYSVQLLSPPEGWVQLGDPAGDATIVLSYSNCSISAPQIPLNCTLDSLTLILQRNGEETKQSAFRILEQ